MSDLEIAKRSVRGSLVLFSGNFLSTIVGAVAVILIARLLGPGLYGAFTLVIVIPGLLTLLIGFGVNVAVVRYSAYYLSLGRPDDAKRITKNAILFLSLFGVLLSAVNYVAAGYLTPAILHRPELTVYVQEASISIAGGTILSTAATAATGWNWMGLSGFSQVLQSMLKLAISPVLIILGFAVFGAVAGYVAAAVLAGAITLSALYFYKLRGGDAGPRNFIPDVKMMVRYGMPAYVGGLVSGVATYYVTILLAIIASNAVVGYYQAALNFTYPMLLLSSSIGTTLFPAFASLDGAGGSVSSGFRYSVKYVAFLMAPSVFLLAATSTQLIRILYGVSYLPAVYLLQLLALSNLPLVIGLGVVTVFFNGVGKTRYTMYCTVAGAAVLAAAVPLLSIGLNLGVPGLIYALFLSYLVTTLVGLFLSSTRLKSNIDFRPLGSMALASVLAYAVTTSIPNLMDSTVFTFVVYVVVFLVIYLTVSPLLRALNVQDIDRLSATLGQLRFVGDVVAPLLRYERYILVKTAGVFGEGRMQTV